MSSRTCLLILLVATSSCVVANAKCAQPATLQPAATRDGQHDFDFEIGNWKTHLKRRLHPLTGTNEWVEYDGTTIVRKVWGGKSNLVELEVDGKPGHIEGASWRLYNAEARQWSLRTYDAIVGWARSEGMVRVVLAPSEGSRPLYSAFGFRPAADSLLRLEL